MGQEQRRGSKELRKPKKAKEKVIAAAPTLKGVGATPNPSKKK
ncbi:hypothetical protein [Aurantimonas coralicida]|nr:hypothetical protein [Aurantimonas coralicida]